jgi:hypothetical protein
MQKILAIVFIGFNYLFAQNINGSFFPMRDKENGQWYFVDKNGEKTIDIQEKNLSYVHAVFSNRALAKDSIKNKWGYLDSNGKWAILPIYDTGEDFVDNYTVVSNKCNKKCNKSDRGLLTDYIAQAIDLNGKVLFTDNSQDPEPFSRRMLFKHVGKGVFVYNSGIGVADLKYYCDINGNVISDRINLYDTQDFHLYYNPELNAYFCKNHYIDATGKEIIDLRKYDYVSLFENGYCWAETYNEETDKSAKVLLDKNLKEVINATIDDFLYASAIVNDSFTYEDEAGVMKLYNLKTKKSTDAPEKQEWEKIIEAHDIISYPAEEIIMLVEFSDYVAVPIGFINKDKKVFLVEDF